ncbi:unnamed protein product [Linum tenue]|uniref:TF-B3 domain-containing protein n=1 Tax=Linum tenue TaxID=586396 RepID=A0AAV0RC93_9ROSI|nr:unnamed protein product [Linum tenue]
MTTHFLKQLTEDTIKHKRMLIPGEFLKKCGRENLSNPVVLEPTVGDPREREMELYEDGGGFWLRNGWQEFVDHYKLSHGCYLLFEYKSYSRFKLLMLGANGLDWEFPASSFVNGGSNGNQEFPEAEEEESVYAHSVEILGPSEVKEMNNNDEGVGRQPAQRRSAENPKQKGVTSARKRRTADDGERRQVKQDAPRRDRANGTPFGRNKDENSRIPSIAEQEDEPAFSWRPSSSKPSRTTTTEAVDEDLAKFTGFSLMKDKNYNNNNNNNGDGGGRQSWFAANANHEEYKRTGDRKKRRTAEGGQNVKVNKEPPRRSRANGSSSPFMFAREVESASMGPPSSRHSRPTIEAADGFASQTDFLQVIISKNSLAKKGLRMQGGFVERHITNWKDKMLDIRVEQETWPVGIVSDHGVPTLSRGWLAFARQNSLKVGDTLIIVPTATEGVLTVHILRCS